MRCFVCALAKGVVTRQKTVIEGGMRRIETVCFCLCVQRILAFPELPGGRYTSC